ncbi:MAG: NADH:ubiquinone reductase (Na(+)-transporting) subunit C [Prevotellaceae bacterium]|nr:NADH:ubiquinone reductase (Na(+)-transporting) subunit C [Prevotellaceae bacterium]
MAKLNTNSNTYTILYAAGIVIVVAFLLAFVSSALKPTQDANVAIDKKQQILASLNLRNVEKTETEAKFAEVIQQDMIYDVASTDVLDEGKSESKDQAGFKVESKEFAAKRPFYIATVDGATKYVIPVTGAGLWGGIWGYIALDDDCETVFGTYFSHESETAGLGARITEDWFQTSFAGKKLHAADDASVIALSVVKKGKEGNMSPDNYVNGVTGATLTSNGVNDMIQKCLGAYQDILAQYKK